MEKIKPLLEKPVIIFTPTPHVCAFFRKKLYHDSRNLDDRDMYCINCQTPFYLEDDEENEN